MRDRASCVCGPPAYGGSDRRHPDRASCLWWLGPAAPSPVASALAAPVSLHASAASKTAFPAASDAAEDAVGALQPSSTASLCGLAHRSPRVQARRVSRESTTPPHCRVRATASALGQRFGDAAFSWSDAEAVGVSRDRVERACAAGLIARVGRGWYVAVSDNQESTWERSGFDVVSRGRLHALGDPEATVLCGTSAAAV